MPDTAQRPNRIPWPPLLYGGLAVFAFGLQQLYPLPWPEGLVRNLLAAAGLALVCLALGLEVAAALAFRRHHTTILPNRGASALITGGPFALSRNPIYLANTLLVAGAGLLAGIAWLLAAALLAAVLTHHLAIRREERHLATCFGTAWEDYASRTPRWLFIR